MDNHGSCSVYELITKLCERMLISSGKKPNKENIKKLRAISYEILLSKKISCDSGTNLLEDNKDPISNLLAWQFMLIYTYKLPEHAKKIQNTFNTLEKSSGVKDDLGSVLYFLIQLRNPPEIDSGISSLSLLSEESCVKYRIFSNHSFHINLPPICSNAKYNNSSFYLNPPPPAITSKCINKGNNNNCEACMRIQNRSCCVSSCSLFKDIKSDELVVVKSGDELELIEDDNQFEDPTAIWDLVSKTVYTPQRTWESLGNPCPDKEKDFLMEASSEVINKCHEFVHGKTSDYLGCSVKVNKIIEHESFIKHLRLLLVGTSSDSFNLSDNEMYLVENITVDGISRDALLEYTQELTSCGSIYRILNSFSQIETDGFVLKAFCNSLQEYLEFYRVATFTITEEMGLLHISNHIKPLYGQLKDLISICQITSKAGCSFPNTVDLLNDLYERLNDFPIKKIGTLLCSSFSTCIQVYFGRFLQQWIFDGILNDPHDEFFIVNPWKSLKPISRSYWTKCFNIKQEKTPDFLIDLANDILYCGKAMNLLKICAPKNPLCTDLMEQKRNLLTSRLNWGEISDLEENVTCYNYECILKCGSRFSIKEYLSKIEEDNSIIADMVIKRRAEIIKRLEMEKLIAANKLFEEKQRNIAALKADYDKALQDKKTAITNDLLKELEHRKTNLKIQFLRKQVIEEEALKLIDYYDNLMEESDRKLSNIQKHLDRIKTSDIKPQESASLKFYSTTEIKKSLKKSPTKDSIESNSDSSFHSATSDNPDENNHNQKEIDETNKIKEEEMFPFLKPDQNLMNEKNKSICLELDTINANLDVNSSTDSINNNDVGSETNLLTKLVRENKEAALKNKMKVMSDEMGFIWMNDATEKNNEDCCGEPKIEKRVLSDLEKNRLKVMSSEFDINLNRSSLSRSNSNKTISNKSNLNQTNSNNLISNNLNSNNLISNNSDLNRNDNENILNGNFIGNENDLNKNDTKQIIKYERNLTLNLNQHVEVTNQTPSTASLFSQFWKSPNFEFPKPMSIDSTPSTLAFCSTSMITTGESINEFQFPKESFLINPILTSKKTTSPDLNNLEKQIEKSVSIPLKTQMKLVDNELLRHFFVNLKYLDHLRLFRSYFFLMDGEFSRNITEELFNKLYQVKNSKPTDLLNVNTLQHLIRTALESSIKSPSPKDDEFSSILSFKINNIPKNFDLNNPDVLGCLSLTYEVAWPLNILLPKDIVSKYNEVFKFLLKLNMVSWVLKQMFQVLKLFSRQCGSREGFLILSPHFKRIQSFRHRMSQFLQTLQNYVMSEVLQPSWSVFEKKITSAMNLDDLYDIHTGYVKDILFKCLLNKRFTPVREVIENIVTVILKFHRYLSSGSWVFDGDEGVYSHTNMNKLETIFRNFEEFAVYIFKAGRKIVRVGYQPHLLQLLDMLDVNEYYSRNINYEG